MLSGSLLGNIDNLDWKEWNKINIQRTAKNTKNKISTILDFAVSLSCYKQLHKISNPAVQFFLVLVIMKRTNRSLKHLQ
jgi:hypothetical protein